MASVPELTITEGRGAEGQGSDGQELRWGQRRARLSDVTGLHERYHPWSGRTYLLIEGPGWVVPIGAGYGAVRAALRRALPDVPMSSDWMDGRFPSVSGRLPPNTSLFLALSLTMIAAAAAGVWAGWAAALSVCGLAVWPLGRLRGGWVVRPEGLRGGPPWAPLAPWEAVEAVVVSPGRRFSRVWTRGPAGGHHALIPTALLPAFRARVRRLGGLEVRELAPDLDDVYARWSRPALGIPWGVGLGTLGAAWMAEDPFVVLAVGAWVVAGTGLLGAIVHARHGGWGFGAVAAAVLLYGLVLASVAASGVLLP